MKRLKRIVLLWLLDDEQFKNILQKTLEEREANLKHQAIQMLNQCNQD